MPLKRQQKVDLALDYKKIVDAASGFILFDYRGLTVAQISDLRRKVRETGAQVQVVKNRLLKRAVEDKAYASKISSNLKGTTAVIFANATDPIAPAKALVDFAKTNDKVKIKAGVVGKDYMDAKGVEVLSKIPSQKELMSKVLGSIKAPASKMLGCLKGGSNKIHGLITALAEKKEKEAA